MTTKYQEIVQKSTDSKIGMLYLQPSDTEDFKEGQVVNRLVEEYDKEHKQVLTDASVLEKVAEASKNKVHIAKSKSGIVVKGIDDVAVRFSRCCNPVPGDEIVGFVTRGRGLSIHRTDCVNMLHLTEAERARLIDAEWEGDVAEKGRRSVSGRDQDLCIRQTGLPYGNVEDLHRDGSGCEVNECTYEQAGDSDH